jgi:hypothetical protein
MSRGKAAIGPNGGQKILNRDSPHKPSLSTRVFHPAKSPARDPSQTFSPCHRLLPVNDALAAQGLVASDIIALACLPNGLLASSSGDSTIQLWDPTSPDAARRCFSTRYLRRATLEDAGLHEADKPDI